MSKRVGAAVAAVAIAAAASGGTAGQAAADPSPTPLSSKAAADRAVTAAAGHPRDTRAGDDQRFHVKDVLLDRDGSSHTRLTRTYKDLPVLGGDLVVHQSPTGAWRGSSLTLAQAPANASPTLTATAAKKRAIFKKNRVRDNGKLVVEARTPDHKPRLAWLFRTEGRQADGTPSRVYVSVDAATGKVLLSEETIQTGTGDGQSLYSGTVPLETTPSGSTNQLKDPTRGNTYTGDAQNKEDGLLCPLLPRTCAPAKVFTDADNHWGNGTTTDRATAAVDAQYGTNVTWDFYKNVFDRNGINNDGKGSYSRVHYGRGYNNAFWDPSCFCMTYGDGDGSTLGPLVSLDVAGHEMTHGVTAATANLAYSGESGGLNEATSDIFGTAVEFHAGNGSDAGDYLIGEKIVRPGFGRSALRYMYHPSLDGNSVNSWSPTVGTLDVHYSSGVANHFFYLLAEGSVPKTFAGVPHDSPTPDNATGNGIGREAAAKIWYRALTVYMTSSTNYSGARTATLNAARDLYDTGSIEYNTVAAAWSAVNVG